MKKNLFREFVPKASWAIILLVVPQTTSAELLHRYSFDGPSGTTVITDSAGGANGTLINGSTTAGLNGSGQLVLDGNQSKAWVSLPSGLMRQLTNATFETWVNDQNPQLWAELWTFGTNNGSAGQGDFLSLIPVDGGVSDNIGLDNHTQVIAAGPMPANQEVCLAVVYNYLAGTASIYLNGAIAGQGAVTIPLNTINDADNYIGQSQWYGSGDPYFTGILDEFRIYNTAFTPDQIEADYEAGPGVINASPGNLTAIQFGNSSDNILGAVVSPVILGTYSALTNKVNISILPGITYSSDNTNVMMFGTDGNFHTVGVGSTTIHASYQSFNAALVVTVAPQPPVLLHRYSFDGAPGTTVVTDSVSGANGTLINGSGTATLTGSGQLVLDGNASSAYVSLPPGILRSLTNATFQIWVNNQDLFSDWAELWAFGTNNGAQGLTYVTLIPNNPVTHKLRLDVHGAGGTVLDAPSPLPVNNNVCVTVTYNYSAQSASIYVAGRKVATTTEALPLYSIPDGDNYIGQSEWYGSGDPYFNGILDEFRIYSGAESDLQIAVDAAAGPDTIITNPGTLLSLMVQALNTNIDAHGAAVPIQVLANFANVSNVDVTTLSGTAITSANTSVGAVANGNFIPQNAGVTTVNATYGGKSGSLTLNVVDTNAWPTLLHRWRFNEPPGSTVITDAVGNINGTVNGPMTFTGQEMITPSGNPPPGSDGLPTSSSGWVSFPANQGLVTGLPNEASFEIWVVWNGGGVWQEMFDFGQAATPGYSLGGYQYVMISPYDGANHMLRAEWDQNPAYDVTLLGPALQTGVLSQIVWTHDQDRQLDKLYLNGQLVASAVNTALWSSLPDTDNWLARDEWPDPMFNGAYADFRIWNGALTGGQVANLYKAGPEVIVGPPLTISTSGNQVILQWPANATGFTLQASTNLMSGTWNTVPGTATATNGLNNLTLPASQLPTFYRLRQ